MLVCGGILAGLDSRNSSAAAAKVGGVVQLATYVSGLSGGSWATGLWALAGYPMFEQLRDQVWSLEESTSSSFLSFSDGEIDLYDVMEHRSRFQ